MEAEKKQRREWPAWLRWLLRVVFIYVGLLVLVLAVAILTITGTFTLIVIEAFTDNHSLRQFSETYLVPVSEFMWGLFTWLVPGL
ncbi:hypothetical protein [Shouchella shacheensis]|uniref:hypothetical protein n=1 Tax=Shouchella shacheensis TaxID=1649580 RepID=UPI00073FBB87|nr:hypothetical protein [Shouchella shacheensis]